MQRKPKVDKPSWPKILSRRLPSGNIQYRIDAQVGGSRVYESFKTEAEAVDRAWEVHKERQNKGQIAFNLSVEDRVVAARCIGKLTPYGVSLEQATDYFVEHVAKYRTAPSAKEIGNRLVEQTAANGRTPKTVVDLRHRLKTFLDAFGERRLAEVTLAELERWAGALEQSPRTRCHALTKLSMLYRYAHRHGWVAENLAAKLSRPKTRAAIPHHLTTAEAARLLVTAPAHDLLPFVVLGLFAGIRPDEIRRLNWSSVKLDTKVIILDSTATKTGQHRVVELNPTCLEWLKLCHRQGGKVVDMPEITFRRHWKKLREAAGFSKWGSDDMRHSCATYSCALTGDYAKVAADLGHDVRVLHRHYRGLASKAEAERFFALLPSEVIKGKIVAMPTPVDPSSEQANEQAAVVNEVSR